AEAGRQLHGRYAEIIGFIGENQDGVELNSLGLSMDVDFITGKVSNGSIEALVTQELADPASYNETWNVYFSGEIADGRLSLTPLPVSQIHGSDHTQLVYQVGDAAEVTVPFAELDLSLRGDFVSDAGRERSALVGSFYFNAPGAVRSLTGLALVEGD